MKAEHPEGVTAVAGALIDAIDAFAVAMAAGDDTQSHATALMAYAVIRLNVKPAQLLVEVVAMCAGAQERPVPGAAS